MLTCLPAAGAERLYALTDEAIRACPASTRWALVTNGDNVYADGFLGALLRAPPGADAVAFDYYSRYHRSTGPACTRFQISRPGALPCKRNRQPTIISRISCCMRPDTDPVATKLIWTGGSVPGWPGNDAVAGNMAARMQ